MIVLFTEFMDLTSADFLVRAVARLVETHLLLVVVLRDEELETLRDAAPQTADDVTRAVTAGALLRDRLMVLTLACGTSACMSWKANMTGCRDRPGPGLRRPQEQEPLVSEAADAALDSGAAGQSRAVSARRIRTNGRRSTNCSSAWRSARCACSTTRRCWRCRCSIDPALSSLSVARETSLDKGLVAYLEQLCTRAYFQLYGVPTSAWRQFLHFFRTGWPVGGSRRCGGRRSSACSSVSSGRVRAIGS